MIQPAPRALALFALGLPLAALPSLAWPQLWPLWVLFGAISLAAWGIDAALCPRSLSWRLESPDTLAMAATGEAVMHLEAPGGLASNLATELRLELSETMQPSPSVAGRLVAGGSKLRVPLVAKRRGRAAIEEAWVRTLGPLGLMRSTLRLALRRPLEVVPNLTPVHAAALAFANPRETMAGLKIERFVGDGSEFEALREYQAGMDPRSIDWKSSARHTRLLSRELRAERNHQVVLALDTGWLMAEPIHGVPRIDHAIHAALLTAYVGLRHGDRVRLFSFDQRPGRLTPPRGGVGALAHLIRYTGELAYSDAETNFTLALTDLTSRLRRRSLVVVMTELVDTVSAELMVENVLRLARRHLVIFVALRNPYLEELATAEPHRMEQVERAVIADSIARERQLVLRRLRRRGVTCIDEQPDRLNAALLNHYLEIKRRERI
ncbi:MAG: DUF58 domain-containing protein [Deltaproteobacteria bacterium]|nr:DUF58 domain-containing protein [Deltaproteobacteria bacterium]